MHVAQALVGRVLPRVGKNLPRPVAAWRTTVGQPRVDLLLGEQPVVQLLAGAETAALGEQIRSPADHFLP